MKKLLVTALAFAMMFQYGWAQADVLKNFAYDGSIDVQATSANNIEDFNSHSYDQIGDAQTRVMLNMGWDLLDDVHAKVGIVKNDGIYGSANATPANSVGNSQPIDSTAGTLLGDTFIDQAYFKIDKLFGAFDTTMGRQFYGDPGDIVAYFGPYSNLYGMPVSLIDMARFDWANDAVGVTGIVGKTKGATALGDASEAGNIDVRGLTATVKNLTNANAGVYVYDRVTHKSTLDQIGTSGNDNLWIAGLKGKYTMGGAWVRGEFAKNFGEDRNTATPSNYNGWALKLDGGYKADLAPASVTPWLQFAIGSGGAQANHNFTAINPNYMGGGIWNRFAGITGNPQRLDSDGPGTGFDTGALSDLVNWGLGVKATPAALSKLTTGISYWDYRFQSASSLAAGAVGNTHIGSEIDLNLDWAHSQNVSVDAGIGSFMPGGEIANENGGPVNSAFLANFDVHVKF